MEHGGKSRTIKIAQQELTVWLQGGFSHTEPGPLKLSIPTLLFLGEESG